MRVPEEHRKSAAKQHFKFAILTISTSKAEKARHCDRHTLRATEIATEIGDISGETAIKLLKSRGHDIVIYDVLPDDAEKIRASVMRALSSDADVIITTGGTGLARKDVTIESVSDMIDKEITGFGEIFRMKSYEKIGNAAILSRSIAGVINNKLIFCLPGSPDAVELAMNEIILDELPHIMRHVRE